jgi:CRISPR-associated exonuclease Cas4
MLTYLIIFSVTLLIIGLILLFNLSKKYKNHGVLNWERVYADTESRPGEVLYSKTLNLVGKPDYLVKKGDMIFPVEIKSGKTPNTPYESHTMQLMAYCLLVEENFGIRPTGGYLKYPEREFRIAYTDQAKQSLYKLVEEISINKKTNQMLSCDHPQHNLKPI